MDYMVLNMKTAEVFQFPHIIKRNMGGQEYSIIICYTAANKHKLGIIPSINLLTKEAKDSLHKEIMEEFKILCLTGIYEHETNVPITDGSMVEDLLSTFVGYVHYEAGGFRVLMLNSNNPKFENKASYSISNMGALRISTADSQNLQELLKRTIQEGK